MKISSFFKCLYHGLTFGQMCKDSQFQLSVISHDKFLSLFCYKRLPDLVNVLVQCWLILDVGLAA